MIRSIIATCLLTFSCSGGKLKVEQPRKANNSEFFSGNYCYKDTINFDNVQQYCEDNNLNTIDFTININTSNQYDFSNWYVKSNETKFLQRIAITYYPSDNSVELVYFGYDTSFTAFNDYLEIASDDTPTYFNGTTVLMRINNGVTLTYAQQLVVNAIYSKTGNQWVVTYDGYYNTMNKPLTIFNVLGNIVIDNNLYVNLTYNNIGNTENSYWYQSTYFDYSVNIWQVKVFNERTNLTNLYFSNTMMTAETYQRLQQYGTFAYVEPPVQEYSFSEFFFSIMDAPIYYLTSLFSFDLFGVSLYVALASLVTMAILIIVIKKVV